jgi:Flp pilus assembly protein TadG
MKRIERLGRDESGMSYVFIGLSMMAFLSASMLAIDVGMLLTARTQAQNSADAGALAGATALIYDNYNDRTPTGPAVTNALAGARANQVMSGQVSVTSHAVQFLTDPSGQNDRVKVTVYRQASRGNAVATLIARFFGTMTADIGATATAEAAPSNAMTCVKPFTIPDKWIEKQTPPWDADDSFDVVDKKGKPVANPDVYIGPDDPANYTGYNAERDAGTVIILKADNGSKIAPSFYQAWDMPLYNAGGSDYRDNIANCNTSVMGYGDIIAPEPGMMTGPTAQGMTDLINKDPNATWNDANKRVDSQMHPSPRVIAIPLFDPVYYDTGKRNGSNATLKFVNYLGFFVERMQGSDVVGHITPIGGLRRGAGFGPAPVTAFPRAIRLVQ